MKEEEETFEGDREVLWRVHAVRIPYDTQKRWSVALKLGTLSAPCIKQLV